MGKTVNLPKKKIEIPEETKLLLAFANLGKTQGIAAENLLGLKRKPKASSDEKLVKINRVDTWIHPESGESGEIKESILLGKHSIYDAETKEQIFSIPDNQKIIKEFFNNYFPKVKKFKLPLEPEFPVEKGLNDSRTLERISSIKRTSKIEKDIIYLYASIRFGLTSLSEVNCETFFLLNLPEIKPMLYFNPYKIRFEYLGNPLASYNEIIATLFLNFIFNQRELHDLLRLCPTCGRFFFRKGKSVYCSDGCRKRFNQATREKDVTRQAKKRAREKEEQKLKAAELKRVKQEARKKNRLKKSEEKKYWENEARKYREFGKSRNYAKETIDNIIATQLDAKGLSFEEWKKKRS